jgi:hypothetical protein
MESIRAINKGSNYGSYEMRGKRWRVAPRPGGFYLAYLNDLIERNHRKGKHIPDVADDEYWQKRREDELLKDQPLKKAA